MVRNAFTSAVDSSFISLVFWCQTISDLSVLDIEMWSLVSGAPFQKVDKVYGILGQNFLLLHDYLML